ncbi:aldehyde dehydrogenase family protein [Aureivirga sp. CE67]|uniref:aldehyde dehydrogenase family protein n=1 Tax=Aureivirga sp. CE67 TaxID=1788983 RepID=UPI0018CAEA4B|nr:aldehyde dehydrogenase family protein [Aureivirga sp. CE67]
MTAKEAFEYVDAKKWSETSVYERLYLLEEIKDNLKKHADELGQLELENKNNFAKGAYYRVPECLAGIVYPLATIINACVHLYESLSKGKMPAPENIHQINDTFYDVEVHPLDIKEKLLANTQTFHLHIEGKPRQINPLEKKAGIIAILGAGNYSSTLEIIKALYLENSVVIFKSHELNKKTDKIWRKVFAPLIQKKAIAFCDFGEGKNMTQLEGLSKIYFTGGYENANIISRATETHLISECGGNNPLIVVPGIRDWTKKEMEHHANHIATAAKLNGGALCGRPQTIITSKKWKQRAIFLQTLKEAITKNTPASGTYYPNSDKIKEQFLEEHPDSEILKADCNCEPECDCESSEFIFIENVAHDSYAVKTEAFCQIMNEVVLDVPDDVNIFLETATKFCNTKLHGTLTCMILIDKETKKEHQEALLKTLLDLKYGSIAVNANPVLIFLTPFLTWGGNEDGEKLVSGNGNFGNIYCFENVKKSILVDHFMSLGHILRTNQKAYDHLTKHMTEFALDPSWINLTRLLGGVVIDSFRGKDF